MSVLTRRPRLSSWSARPCGGYSAQLKGGNNGKGLAALEAVDAEVASVQREDLADLLSIRHRPVFLSSLPRSVRQDVAERLFVATRHVTGPTPGNPDQICDEGIGAVG